jgi:hypothetical protein
MKQYYLTVKTGTDDIEEITIKGRYIDKFTGNPIANMGYSVSYFSIINSQYLPSNENGEFMIETTLADMTPGDYTRDFDDSYRGSPYDTGRRSWGYWSGKDLNLSLKRNNVIHLFKHSDGSATVELDNFDLERNKVFPVTGPVVDVGDIPVWRAVDLKVYSDKKVTARLYYPEEAYDGREGDGRFAAHGQYQDRFQNQHSFGGPLFVVGHPTTVKLTDEQGTVYIPDPITLDTDCNTSTQVYLWFFNDEFRWVTADVWTDPYPTSYYYGRIGCRKGTSSWYTYDESTICGLVGDSEVVPGTVFDGTGF